MEIARTLEAYPDHLFAEFAFKHLAIRRDVIRLQDDQPREKKAIRLLTFRWTSLRNCGRVIGFQRGFKAEANRIALRVRASMGLPPIEPAAVCAHFNIALKKLSEVSPGCAFLGRAQVVLLGGHRTVWRPDRDRSQ